MYRCGALIAGNEVLPALTSAAKLVQDVLYLPLCRNDNNALSKQIERIYRHASELNPKLDVRIVLPSQQKQRSFLQHSIDALLSPLPSFSELQEHPAYGCLTNRLKDTDLDKIFQSIAVEEPMKEVSVQTEDDRYDTVTSVALGGTFDCIHNGHRLLLTEAVLRATRRVLVGISDGPLLSGKVLPDLIATIQERVSNIEAFLGDVCPDLVYDVVPITDVYGPTAWDTDLTGLIVSLETARGGDKINQERERKGLQPLAVFCIGLIVDDEASSATDVASKISSSNLRKQQLGQYRSPKVNRCRPPSPPLPGVPYMVGLTGTTASGKSTIAKRLGMLGANIIDCDKLGHASYEPGTAGYLKIVEEFGSDVVKEDGTINRRALGSIVFSDASKLKTLNAIVWPEIWKMVIEQAKMAYDKGVKVVIVDAAVLLQAEWDCDLNEVWGCIIPHDEALKRVMERDGVSDERARNRLSSQVSNKECADHAHVIFSSQWSYEYTQSQVEKAWTDLQERLQYV